MSFFLRPWLNFSSVTNPSQIVCFLDYNDFFSYNFTNPDRDEYPLHTLDVGEATRLIIMRIHVTKIEQAGPDSEYSSALPIVHYEGISRPLDDSWDDNASSDLRGMYPARRWYSF